MAFAPPRLLPLPPPPAAAESTRAVSARHHGGRTAPELSGPTPRVVVVTSGKGGVGKTTTTANLAASLAGLGLPAVAVDADVRAEALLPAAAARPLSRRSTKVGWSGNSSSASRRGPTRSAEPALPLAEWTCGAAAACWNMAAG